MQKKGKQQYLFSLKDGYQIKLGVYIKMARRFINYDKQITL